MITINREDYGNALKMHCDDVRYIPGVGVDIDKFHGVQIKRDVYRASLNLKPDDFVILAVGEISARKNQRIIVEALARKPISHAVFVVCGNYINGADTKESVEELARQNGVDVRFLGVVRIFLRSVSVLMLEYCLPRAKVSDLLALKCSLPVFPSLGRMSMVFLIILLMGITVCFAIRGASTLGPMLFSICIRITLIEQSLVPLDMRA